ncbi:metallophosphoesterase [Knoellia sp. p5-6-4]|uniref:metallophosphoesterase family protein n=1 Tax=unclassified Knoellia TaxID=2618719 RepID=UPI0023DC90AB|nr:metallophosphoesterase [Knoellia sp. p5-6-4]MDF2144180.1 metallophosphoesterase [Knoellia sp. p5-6-4]
MTATPAAAVAGLLLLLATGCTGTTAPAGGRPGDATSTPATGAPTGTGGGGTGTAGGGTGTVGGGAGADGGKPARSATVISVGDIAQCGNRGDDVTADITAKLLSSSKDAAVLTLGDHAYPDGSTEDFRTCYDPSWGRLTPRVRPAPGNHDYDTRDAAGYFAYFGKAAGERGKGWYSFNLGSWHLVALNSNCDEVGGCDAGSAQGRWLRDDLARNRSRCTLAYWHHPRFSSGWHGSSRRTADFWDALAKAGADVVLSGHDHDYERFAPQRPDGGAARDGIRQFVVGTGGAESRAFADRAPNSERRITGVHAVLRLQLTDGGYEWALVGADGASRPLDAGRGTCS